MSQVYKIYTGLGSSIKAPHEYITQFAMNREKVYPNFGYITSDSQVISVPYVCPSTVYMGPSRRIKTFSDLGDFIHGNGTGYRNMTVYVDEGSYNVSLDFKHPNLFFRKTAESDSVTLNFYNYNPFSERISFTGFNITSNRSAMEFNRTKSINFTQCSFAKRVNLRSIDDVYIDSCTFQQGLKFFQCGRGRILNSTLSSTQYNNTLQSACSQHIFLQGTNTISNNATSSVVGAVTCIYVYGTMMEALSNSSVTLNMTNAASNSRYGIHVTDQGDFIGWNVTINDAVTGVLADHNSHARLLSQWTFNNCTVQTSPVSQTLGNFAAYIALS